MTFILPRGFSVEDLPKNKTISNEFTKYNSRYEWNEADGKVTMYAAIEIIQPLIKAKNYGHADAI